jgi:hypothetical protein
MAASEGSGRASEDGAGSGEDEELAPDDASLPPPAVPPAGEQPAGEPGHADAPGDAVAPTSRRRRGKAARCQVRARVPHSPPASFARPACPAAAMRPWPPLSASPRHAGAHVCRCAGCGRRRAAVSAALPTLRAVHEAGLLLPRRRWDWAAAPLLPGACPARARGARHGAAPRCAASRIKGVYSAAAFKGSS